MIRALLEALLAEQVHVNDLMEIVAQTPTPIAVFTGPEHRLEVASAAWRDLFAYRGPTGVLPADVPGLAGILAQLDHVERSGASVQVSEVPFVRADSKLERHYTATLRPLRSTRGITGVIVACVDVTDEVIARPWRADWRTALWSGDAGREPDYFNRKWTEYAGPVDAWRDVIHEDDRKAFQDAFAEMSHSCCTSADVRLRRADGIYRRHRVQFALCDDRWYVTAVDIHDSADATATAAEPATTTKRESTVDDRFLAVSHELRAPLTTLLLWERLLRDDSLDAATRSYALDAIHSSAVAQARLVSDLLDVSRSMTGKLRVEIRAVDISYIIEETLADARAAAAAKQIVFARTDDGAFCAVQGDAGRLRQILDNLISNAIKFTPNGGTVTIASRYERGFVVIEVRDTGRGIDEDFLPHVFEPFSQGDDPLTRSEGGLGLGLTISRELVHLHGGTLEAHSDGRDRGACFTFRLPATGTVAPERLVRARAQHALTGISVLLVDDDVRVLGAIKLLLEQTGARVECASSANVAWTEITRRPFDVVISDIAMPLENGYALVRRMRESSVTRDIPAIALSGHASVADRDRAIAAGYNLHVAKPVDIEHLIARISTLVEERRTPT